MSTALHQGFQPPLAVVHVDLVKCHEFDLVVFDGQLGAGEPVVVVGLVKVEVVVGDWVMTMSAALMEEEAVVVR
jgi:hypothetical protein